MSAYKKGKRGYKYGFKFATRRQFMLIIVPEHLEDVFYSIMDEAGWDNYVLEPPDCKEPDSSYKKEPIPSEVRWAVWERDNFTCKSCGSRAYLHIDHVKPESKGGEMSLANLQTLCKMCNIKKGNKHEL